MTIAPGWYQDPADAALLRWWDGASWTDHTSPNLLEIGLNRRAVHDLQREYNHLKTLVVDLRERALLQEVGFYEYAHPLDSSVLYKEALKELQQKIKDFVKSGKAVVGTDKWNINGSAVEGAKMVSDFCKLLLRTYNTEVDVEVRFLKPYGRDAAIARLDKARMAISKLGARMKIGITDQYHALRVREIELTSDYLVKLAEEKEREKEERARLREEAAAQREFEAQQAKLEKERNQYLNALEALRARGDEEAIKKAELKIEEIDDAIRGVIDRKANIRAGYVYVISNIGAFGENMVKIGMTRRQEPMERVDELGDASVPFRFDVHCIIFSNDAVGLETALHQQFSDRKVNFVNTRREFFYVTPHEVMHALKNLQGDLLSFTETPEAFEWRQSEAIRKGEGANGVELFEEVEIVDDD